MTITKDVDHSVYVIWIGPTDYVVNVHNRVSPGGSISAFGLFTSGNPPMTITMTPNPGYVVTSLAIHSSSSGTVLDTYSFTEEGTWSQTYTPNQNIEIYVTFTPIIYTITVFEGPTQIANTQTYNVTSDPIFFMPPCDCDPAVAGNKFVGWTGTGIQGMETAYVTIPTGSIGNRTYYEVWEPESYSIHYDLNGGYNHSGNKVSYTEADLPLSLQTPFRGGFTFLGWYTNSTFAGSPVDTIPAGTTGNKSFYARWEVRLYTVEFDINGGTGSAPDSIQANYNAEIVNLPSSAGFSKDNHTFSGWATTSGGMPITSYRVPADNSKLYAVWAPNKVTITFDINGGFGVSPPTVLESYGAPVTLPDNSDNGFSRTGYTFLGWATTSGGTVPLTS